MNRIFAILCLSLFAITSCKKYKDGPYVSIWSRKERIEGKWVVNYAEKNQQELTAEYNDLVWEFTRNYSVIETTDTSKINGIWGTMTNDKDFVIDYDNGTRSIYEIIRLTRKDFWVRNRKSDLIFHLKPF